MNKQHFDIYDVLNAKSMIHTFAFLMCKLLIIAGDNNKASNARFLNELWTTAHTFIWWRTFWHFHTFVLFYDLETLTKRHSLVYIYSLQLNGYAIYVHGKYKLQFVVSISKKISIVKRIIAQNGAVWQMLIGILVAQSYYRAEYVSNQFSAMRLHNSSWF